MRGTGGALAVAVAALLVCCSADSRQESENDHSGEHFAPGEPKRKEEYQDYLRFLFSYLNGYDDRYPEALREESVLGRSNVITGKDLTEHGMISGNQAKYRSMSSSRNWNNYPNYARNVYYGKDYDDGYAGFVDSLGGGNFLRSVNSNGGGNFGRTLDSIGGGNLVKKNLDHIGGPNLVKRIVDSLGGGNLVRRSDGKYGRSLDSIGGHKVETVDHPGGSSRHIREAGQFGYVPYLMTRRFDYASPFGGKRDSWPMSYGGYYGEGLPKRNFDEIDRSGLDNFVRKRNFDEIDQTSMPFPYAKRFYHQYGPQYLELDMPVSSFDKKRFRPDYPMDEIDLSHFPIGSKRSLDGFRVQH